MYHRVIQFWPIAPWDKGESKVRSNHLLPLSATWYKVLTPEKIAEGVYMPENTPENPEEFDQTSPETDAPALRELDTLPARLGFVETPELARRRGPLLATLETGSAEAIQAQFGAYLDTAEELMNALPIVERDLALTLHKAAIWRDAGKIVQYLSCLMDAHYTTQQSLEIKLRSGVNPTGLGTIIYDEISSFYGTPVYDEARELQGF